MPSGGFESNQSRRRFPLSKKERCKERLEMRAFTYAYCLMFHSSLRRIVHLMSFFHLENFAICTAVAVECVIVTHKFHRVSFVQILQGGSFLSSASFVC